ncbi:MAG: acetyl-coenzyme A synthetase N-terminal domain-containing protein, partial [Hypericibacter sp.]
MTSPTLFPVTEELARTAWIDEAKYESLYHLSMMDPEGFWGEQGKLVDWIKPFTKVKDVDYTGEVRIRWYYDGSLNVSANCLDRHLPQRADQTAILWEGDDPKEQKHVTYGEMHEGVCRLANVLKSHGIKKGDRVTIYMPMIP